MKSKILWIFTSALFIVVFISTLFYLLVRIYTLETEKFDYRYREIVDSAIKWMISSKKDNGFSKSTYILDGVSHNLINFYNDNQIIDTAEFRHTVYKQFLYITKKYQEVDSNLTTYLSSQGYHIKFRSYFVIRELNLLDFDEKIRIYSDNLSSSNDSLLSVQKNSHAVPVYQYQFVGNNFNMKLDYLVDFDNKKSEVISRITLSVLLGFTTLVIVIAIFFLTLRNLLKERKLSQMKTDFINNMTHELKTPLSTISIASKSLENQEILNNPEKITETAKIIARQNNLLSKQINHLLEISKWERGQFELDIKQVDIIKLLKETVESIKWENKNKKIDIEEIYEIDNLKINIDETMVTSAILNIMSNAIKYNQNDPKIKISVRADENLTITITDNGIGIAKDELNHIFDKFYRVSTGNIHNVKGLGLGLFYVKQIMDAHEGQVTATSKLGKGSAFKLIFQLNE